MQLEEGVEQHNALNPKARANKGADKEELLTSQAALKAELETAAAPYTARGYVALEADGANKLKFTNPLGSVSTRKLLAYFQSAAGKAVLSTLTDLGINPVSARFVENMNNQAEGPLSGKTFVLTGTLPTILRSQFTNNSSILVFIRYDMLFCILPSKSKIRYLFKHVVNSSPTI